MAAPGAFAIWEIALRFGIEAIEDPLPLWLIVWPPLLRGFMCLVNIRKALLGRCCLGREC
jgi:hypothetical protein